MASIPLDDRDLQILSVLSREGRISKTDLARRVNLSASPCWERLRRLEKAGLIRGYRAEISLSRLAAHVVVFVVAELETHRAETFAVFERAVADRESIVSCWAIGGGFDYLMQIVVRDIDAYQRLIDDLLAANVGLKRYFTYVVTKDVKAAPVPVEALARAVPQKD